MINIGEFLAIVNAKILAIENRYRSQPSGTETSI